MVPTSTYADSLREQLSIPAICAPMFAVTGPKLVIEACKAGIVGVLPIANSADLAEFTSWMTTIRETLDEFQDNHRDRKVAPLAVNVPRELVNDGLQDYLDVCERNRVELITFAGGNPTELTKRVHEWGGKLFHDITSFRFARKAIEGNVDGLICIGSGGGGHSGKVSHLTLIPQIRSIFAGPIVMAGAVTTGASIRAAEVLGADFAYLGTRFIATVESNAPHAYKQLILANNSDDLMYTERIAGVPANWMIESMVRLGLDPTNLPIPVGHGYTHLPVHVRPWKNLWSAGQGIDLINDVPSVSELVSQLRSEYVAACNTPSLA